MADRTKELGQYPTRVWVAERLVEHYFPNLDRSDVVCEPACGPGAFLGVVPADVQAFGVDIDARMVEAARANTGRDVIHGDFRTVPLTVQPTVILGNPPFNVELIDDFLDRSHALLPDGGRVGFLLAAYTMQTANTVCKWMDRWSMNQDLVPRNVFPGLSMPLLFCLFSKDRRRTMVGFCLYRETADVQALPDPYRTALDATSGSVWQRVVELALARLGGEAGLPEIFKEVEGHRPTQTKFWEPAIRRTVRRYPDTFQLTTRGRYALAPDRLAALSDQVRGAQPSFAFA